MQLPTVWLDVDINVYEWSTDIIDDIEDGYLDTTGVTTYTLDDVYYWGGEVMYENYWDSCDGEDVLPYFPWLDGERSDYDGNEQMEGDDEPVEADEFTVDTDEFSADI